MTDKKEKLAWILYISVAIAVAAHSLYLRLCNPTLMEIQLLIYLWPWWLLYVASILSGYGIFRWLIGGAS